VGSVRAGRAALGLSAPLQPPGKDAHPLESCAIDLEIGPHGLGFLAVGFVGEACFSTTPDMAWARPVQ